VLEGGGTQGLGKYNIVSPCIGTAGQNHSRRPLRRHFRSKIFIDSISYISPRRMREKKWKKNNHTRADDDVIFLRQVAATRDNHVASRVRISPWRVKIIICIAYYCHEEKKMKMSSVIIIAGDSARLHENKCAGYTHLRLRTLITRTDLVHISVV